ncbi:hypothetical protein MJO29_003250 [Puccinia striiformis f. sp. tritici]|nr:hypothetical protein MJO29_003250 [Puccinia striiformis f. sp. tritici]
MLESVKEAPWSDRINSLPRSGWRIDDLVDPDRSAVVVLLEPSPPISHLDLGMAYEIGCRMMSSRLPINSIHLRISIQSLETDTFHTLLKSYHPKRLSTRDTN